jgi:hypothetical protein
MDLDFLKVLNILAAAGNLTDSELVLNLTMLSNGHGEPRIAAWRSNHVTDR